MKKENASTRITVGSDILIYNQQLSYLGKFIFHKHQNPFLLWEIWSSIHHFCWVSILIAQYYRCRLHEFPSWLQKTTIADCMVVAPSSAKFPFWLRSITVGARFPSWLQDITVADCMVVASSSAEFPSWLQSITVGARSL